MPRQSVRVHIFNQTYTLLADEDSSQVEQIARQIDELMVSIAGRASTGDATRVAVLACFHLADKLRTAERKLRQFEEADPRRSQLCSKALCGSSSACDPSALPSGSIAAGISARGRDRGDDARHPPGITQPVPEMAQLMCSNCTVVW